MGSPTLERLICTIVAILIRMRQQTDLAIGLFDLAIAAGFGNGQDLVVGGGATFPYPDDLGLLLRRKRLFLVALIVSAIRCRSIWLRRGSGGACGHAAGGFAGVDARTVEDGLIVDEEYMADNSKAAQR